MFEDMQRMRPLDTFSRNYLKRNFVDVIEESLEYNPNMLAIGVKKDRGKYKGIYYLDLKENCRIICVGKTRSGKTWLGRGFIDRLKKTNVSIFYINDVKNELHTSIEPLQSKFHKLLLRNEKPEGANIVVLRPTYFKKLLSEELSEEEKEKNGLPTDNTWYSPDVSKMTERDFMLLTKAKNMSDLQQIAMEELYQLIKSAALKGEFKIEQINDMIDSLEDLTDGQANKLKRKLKPLLKSCFFEDKHAVPLDQLVNEGYIPALNMGDYENFPEDVGLAYNETIILLVLRELIKARKTQKIGKLWAVIDEAARFFGTDKSDIMQNYLGETFELDTAHGVNYFVLTQFLASLPERVINNARYLLVPANANIETFKVAIKSIGHFRNQQTINNQANKVKQQMDERNYDWLVVDTKFGTKQIISPLAPLSKHKEGSK